MPVITISRQFGAGGITIGKMVSEMLEYTFFDDQLIQMVAEKAMVSPHWVKSLEKEAGGNFQKFITQMVSKRLINRILGGERGYIDEEIYVDLLYEIIKGIAKEGNAVILGRGGQYILKEYEEVYHVLLVAQKDDRVKFMEDHYDLSLKEALKSVESNDKRRINLYRKFGKVDYDQPHYYHIIINTSDVSIEKAAQLMCKLTTKQ